MKLLKAYEDINSGKLSMQRAALKYGVPLSTLSDRVTGRVQFGKKRWIFQVFNCLRNVSENGLSIELPEYQTKQNLLKIQNTCT